MALEGRENYPGELAALGRADISKQMKEIMRSGFALALADLWVILCNKDPREHGKQLRYDEDLKAIGLNKLQLIRYATSAQKRSAAEIVRSVTQTLAEFDKRKPALLAATPA